MYDIRALVIVFYAVLLFIVLIVFLALNKRYETQKDFLGFFIMGIVWIIAGIVLKMWGLTVAGIIMALIGIVNVKKWKDFNEQWNNLSSKDRRIKIVLMTVLGLLVFASMILYFTVL
ncbi:MAG: hypothetical protein SVK54_09050 [candidate division WOR-3 bacterium]|nr:hypothetical protein [candidate division WOR-3 bacterium]